MEELHQGWLTIAPFVASGMITLGKYGPLIKAEKELAGKMRRTLTHAKTKLLESSGELAETLKQSLTTELFGSEANEADKEDEARDKVPVEDEATDDSSDANLDGVVLGEAIRTYANRVLVSKSPELWGDLRAASADRASSETSPRPRFDCSRGYWTTIACNRYRSGVRSTVSFGSLS